jgi:hypothetical protein
MGRAMTLLDSASAIRFACAEARARVPPGGVFELPDVAGVRVDMSSIADLRWLADYVAPHYAFRKDAHRPTTAHVVQLVDAERYRELRALAAERSWRERALYQEEPVLEARDADVVLHVNRRRPLVTVFEQGVTTIVGHPDDPEARMEPIRHVREVMTKQLETRGWFVYHMASVALHGTGVAFVGGKGAGKSSLALGACASGASLISNDRSYVGLTSAGPLIRSWPTTAAIGLGTVCAFEELHRWLADPGSLAYTPQDRYTSGIGLAAALALPPPERAELKDKLELTCAEVAQSFATTLCAVAPLGLIVVSSFEAGLGTTAIEAADAEELLRGQCYTPHDPRYPDFLDLRTIAIAELERESEAQIAALVETVPAVRVRYSDGRDGGAALASYVEGMT